MYVCGVYRSSYSRIDDGPSRSYHSDNKDDEGEWSGWSNDDDSARPSSGHADLTPTNDWGDLDWSDKSSKSTRSKSPSSQALSSNGAQHSNVQLAKKSTPNSSAANLIDFGDDDSHVTSFNSGSSSISPAAAPARKPPAPKPKTLDDELWESLGSMDVKK